MDAIVMAPSARVTRASDRPFQLLDLSEAAAGYASGAGVGDGVLHAFCPHTSCGLAVTELEDGLHEDVERVLEQLAPIAGPWAHDDMTRRHQNLEPDERRNGWSHVRALLATQASVCVPIEAGRLGLGQWQRLFLVELDGPRAARTVVLQAWGRPPGGDDPS